MPSCCQWRSRSRTSAAVLVRRRGSRRRARRRGRPPRRRATRRRARPGSRRARDRRVSSACLSFDWPSPGSQPAQWSRRCASNVFQMRGRSPNAKPTAAPRSRMTARDCARSARAARRTCARCTRSLSSPSGGSAGLSSNGSKCSSTATASPSRSSARSSDHRPTAHHGQAMSETNSIFIVVALCLPDGARRGHFGNRTQAAATAR